MNIDALNAVFSNHVPYSRTYYARSIACAIQHTFDQSHQLSKTTTDRPILVMETPLCYMIQMHISNTVLV